MARHELTTGTRGEAVAAWYLTRAGCRVVDRNVRIHADELDLVVRHGRSLVMVEVKTSSSGYDPFETVDDAKLRRLERISVRYPARVDRIDLVGISLDETDRGGALTIRWLQGVHR